MLRHTENSVATKPMFVCVCVCVCVFFFFFRFVDFLSLLISSARGGDIMKGYDRSVLLNTTVARGEGRAPEIPLVTKSARINQSINQRTRKRLFCWSSGTPR